MGKRIMESSPAHPRALAQEALATFELTGSPVFVGHSWGCHLARAAVEEYQGNCKLIEIDPRIHSLTSYTSAGDIPEYFTSKQELLRTYSLCGMEQSGIDWGWWVKQENGLYRLINPRQIEKMANSVPYFDPFPVWNQLQNNPVLIIAPGKRSSDTEKDLARVGSQCKHVTILNQRHVSHQLKKDEQITLGKAIARWLVRNG